MTIESWMGTLATVVASVTEIEQVHTYADLPGQLVVFPCAVILPVSGSQQYGKSSPGIALHQVQITVYTAGQVLPEALSVCVPLIAKVRDALAANTTLSGLVAYCLPVDPPAAWYSGPGYFKYGNLDLTGIAFRVQVKENETITVS